MSPCILMTQISSQNVITFFPSSDITVSFSGQKVKAHKFVLAARSDHWSNRDLNEISELELTGRA